MHKKSLIGLPFILPGMLILFVVVGIPLVSGFNYSFRDVLLYRFDHQPFIGLDNYRYLFSQKLFLNSVRITLTFTFVVTFFSILFGLLIALVLDSNDIKNKTIFMALFLVPFVSSPVVVGIIWRLFMWEPEYGLINYIISLFGGKGFNWLLDSKFALPSIIITNTWRLIPLPLLILYAALTTISEDVKEAAIIDGVGTFGMLKNITIPIIRPHIFFISLVIFTSAFREFESIYSLSGGGPGRATTVLSILVYTEGLTSANMGEATAISSSMFIITAFVTLVYIRLFMQKKD